MATTNGVRMPYRDNLKRFVLAGSFLGLGLVACSSGGNAPAEGDASTDSADLEGEVCQFPEPLVAGTSATDALADAPQACGQPAFTWLRSGELGKVTHLAVPRRFGRTTFERLLSAADITLPVELKYDAAVRLVTYITQDRGELLEATALVAYPDPAPMGEALEVLALLHGTSGFADGCGAGNDLLYQALGAALAATGRIVVVPDFLGLRSDGKSTGFPHPYLNGQPTAIASLDALRAAARMPAEERGGACLQPRFAALGASQGGHAALWVERLAPYYAREWTFVGGAAAVPPADLVGESKNALLEVAPATSNAAAVFATVPRWYGAGDRLDEVLAEKFVTGLDEILASACKPRVFNGVEDLSEAFTPELLDAVEEDGLQSFDPWGCFVSENGLTTTSVQSITNNDPSFGMLFVTGEVDDLVDTATERRAFATLCEQGMPLQYLECADAGHEDGIAWALPEMLRFIDDRFAGRPLDGELQCTLSEATRCEGTPDE
jgi:dienelactone hydrolase